MVTMLIARIQRIEGEAEVADGQRESGGRDGWNQGRRDGDAGERGEEPRPG